MSCLTTGRKLAIHDKLADILNVSRQTIISIEKGKYNPSLPLAIKIARASVRILNPSLY
nr:helix-turn-helix domain-containing protein [Pradoshia eiseniae]